MNALLSQVNTDKHKLEENIQILLMDFERRHSPMCIDELNIGRTVVARGQSFISVDIKTYL